MRFQRAGARRRWWGAAAALLLIVAVSWPLRHAGTALVVSRDVGAPDAIVMLASHEWERLPAAAAEAHRYPNARVLLTVPVTITPYNCYRCDERVEWLRAEGVAPSRVIVLPKHASNTYGEATAARAWAIASGIRRLLIVTSPYHTRRALATFTQVFGAGPVCVGVVPAAGARGDPAAWWWSSYDRYYVAYEWAAILKYRLVYGVPVG